MLHIRNSNLSDFMARRIKLVYGAIVGCFDFKHVMTLGNYTELSVSGLLFEDVSSRMRDQHDAQGHEHYVDNAEQI
jgi:hypothetical protein